MKHDENGKRNFNQKKDNIENDQHERCSAGLPDSGVLV